MPANVGKNIGKWVKMGWMGNSGAGGALVRAANGLLFVTLAALVAWQAPDVIATRAGRNVERRSPHPRGAVTFVATERTNAAGSDIVVAFSDAVIPADAVGDDAAEGTVRLEPDARLTATWQSRTRLRVRTARPLARARRYHVHVDPAALDLGGRRLSANSDRAPSIVTPPVRVLSVIAADYDDDADGTARAIVIACDLDLADNDFERALTVLRIDENGEDGAPLAVEVARLDTPGEHAWHVALPAGALPDSVAVRIAAGLAPPHADVPLGADWVRTITLRPELFVTSVEPHSDGLSVGLSSDAPLPLDGFLTLDPPVDFQVHRRWGRMRLYGEFRAGATYRVTFHEGFPGAGPARLREEVTRSVRLPDADPSVAFLGGGVVLSSVARHEIGITSVNVARLEVAVRTVYSNNVVRLAQTRRSRDAVFGPWVRKEIAVAGARNELVTERIALDDVLTRASGDSAGGLHQIRLRDLGGDARSQDRLVQITDLGVTVRATRDALAVRVASIAYARPVPGARIVVLTPTNQVLGEATTADDGTAILHYPARGDDRVPFLIDVATDTDRTFVDLDGFEVDLADEAQSGRAYLSGGFECHLQPDRGAVRPGETIRATITARSARGVSPVGADVDARWLGPDGRQRASERLRVNDAGLLVVAYTTTTSDPTGSWRIEVVSAESGGATSATVLGSAAFVVEAFVPDRLEASVALVGTPALGSSAQIRVTSAWLEGSPAAGRPFRATVRLDHLTWHPTGLDDGGYSFARIAEGEPQAPPGLLPPVKGVIGPDGNVVVTVPIPSGHEDGAQGYRATIRAEVSDPSGRPVRAALATDVLRTGPLLGARATRGRLDVVLVSPGGTIAVRDAVADVTLERRHWEWRTRRVIARRGRARYIWEPHVVAEPAGTLTAEIVQGRGTAKLPDLPTQGDWIVAVTSAELDGTTLRADAAVGDASPRPDRLRIEGPGRAVQPGDDVQLTVASPTAGSAFVTLESTTVHAAFVTPVARGRDTINVVVPDDVAGPCVHVVVTVVAPQARAGAVPPYWIVGAASLALAAGDAETVVHIDAPDVVLPGADIEIAFEAPGATRATVALVDEGILRVTRHADPDPLAYFRARRRLETRGADTGSRLMESPGYDPGVLDGGDERQGAAMAPRLEASTSALIQTVALFEGPLRLDPEGRAHVVMRLPSDSSYEGRLRAMVIAAGPTRVGAASAEIIVRAPLGLRIAAPRRLTPGDVSTATVTVRNGTGTEAAIDVRITADTGVEIRGDAARSLVVADGEVTSFDVVLVAVSPVARATITATAVCGAERRSVEAILPVQPAGRFETRRVGLRVAADDEIRVPGVWVEGSRTVRLVIAPGVGADLLPALEALLRYPHGCVEQTSSRAHAVLACRGLLREIAPGAAARADDMVLQGIARLRSMQTPRGGMSFWPGGTTEVDLGSLVALDFLLDARDQGFDVEARSLERLVHRVEHRVSQRDDPAFRAMAVEILSRGGAPVGRWLPDLAPAVKRPEDRARVALALARIGDTESARSLLAGVTPGGDAVAETGGLLFSPARERAFLLRALLEVSPGDERIDPLADSLRTAALDPGRLTTQSQFHVVRALAALHLRDLGDTQAIHGTVFVDDVAHPVEGRTEIAVPPGVPGTPGSIRLALSRDAFAMLAVHGIRIDDHAADKDGGFRITRSLIDVETGEPAVRVRRGGVYDVVLSVAVAERMTNLLVTDILPAGMEAESPRHGAAEDRRHGERRADYVDVRDDRVLLHINGPVSGAFHVRYRAHAVFPGRYAAAPPIVEALYAPGSAVRGRRSQDGLEIVR